MNEHIPHLAAAMGAAAQRARVGNRCLGRTALAAVVSILGAGAFSHEAAAQPAPASLADHGQLAAFADDLFAREMANKRIPGAVLVVVHGGQVVLSRGYGYAGLERRIPVDPDRTLFRIGSVSKLFTATAAMQLVEQGRLTLDGDVNAYSGDVRVEPAFGKPVTLHHLLTHSAGFEERLVGLAARDTSARDPLREILGRDMPARVRPPGVAVSYSNHGTALVGHLIEHVSGMPFHEYVRRHVQEPIGMRRSGFRPPPEVLADIATGYELVDGEYRQIPRDVIRLEPAGGFVSTGDDMARFLLAHLGGGASADGRILSAETTELMHSPQVVHAGVPAFSYGFYGSALADRRLLMHTGGWKDFRSLLFFLPDDGVGVFLSYNRADEGPVELQQEFMRQFLGRYFPQAASPPPTASSAADPAPLVGHYRYIRRSHTSPEKVLALLGAHVQVRRDDGDTLVATGLAARPVRLIPAGGLRFRRDDGLGHVVFEDVRSAGATRLASGPDLPVVHERIRWWETPGTQLTFIALMVLAFLSALLRWPILGIARLIRRRESAAPQARARQVSGAAWAVLTAGSLLNLVFLVAFPIAFLGEIVGGIPDFVYGMPPLAAALLVLPVVTAVMALGSLWLATATLRQRSGTRAARIHLAAVTIALLLFVPFTWYWRLLTISG